MTLGTGLACETEAF